MFASVRDPATTPCRCWPPLPAQYFPARQVLLHIMPGDAGYGSALLGYHYYTWAFIGFAVAIVLIAAMLLFDRQFDR